MNVASVSSCERARIELVERVRSRRAELEEAILARIRQGASSSAGAEDAEYLAGLRLAVSAAIDHGLVGVEHGEEGAEEAPPEVTAQARRAARVGVSVDTVLRRYVLGSNLLGDFLMRESASVELADGGETLRDMLSAQANVLDNLLARITEEYARELERIGRSPEQRRAERVRRLLAGGHCETAELGYELEAWHVGAIASGPDAAELLRHIARELGGRLLCVSCGEGAVWGWFGGVRPPAHRVLERALAARDTADTSLALGEPASGLEGWRITHLQAQAAMRVALRCPRPVTRYADVALLASVLRDDALAGSLVEIYLAPLGSRRNGGGILRETLRAYFAAEHNASSAASALGVTRHTVQNRLRTIEERLGHALRTRQAELEVALRLEELDDGLVAAAGIPSDPR